LGLYTKQIGQKMAEISRFEVLILCMLIT